MARTGPASGGVMALPGPATLKETIKAEVKTSFRQVLSSHTDTRPPSLGGPVCGPLAMLLKTTNNQTGFGCSLELHSSFQPGDGQPIGMVSVEAMPTQKAAIQAVCLETLIALLLRDPDATHLSPGHFLHGNESVKRVRAAARSEQMLLNTAASGAVQMQVNVAAKAPPPPPQRAVPLAPSAQQSVSQWLPPEPPTIGKAPASTAPTQEQPPMHGQPQPPAPQAASPPQTYYAPQHLAQHLGPATCVSQHVGKARGTARPATSASGGGQQTMAQDASWNSRCHNWAGPPDCLWCKQQPRQWRRSSHTPGNHKWACHHCCGKCMLPIKWVAFCERCQRVVCEHCLNGMWKGNQKYEENWAAIGPNDTFLKPCASAMATSDNASSAGHSGTLQMDQGHPPAPGGGLPKPAAADTVRPLPEGLPQCQQQQQMTGVLMGPPPHDGVPAPQCLPQHQPQHQQQHQQQPLQKLAAGNPAVGSGTSAASLHALLGDDRRLRRQSWVNKGSNWVPSSSGLPHQQ